MSAKTAADQLAAKLASQEKMRDEIAELKRTIAKQEKAARQKRERQIGRLALAAGLDPYSEDELKNGFAMLVSELQKKSENGRHQNVVTASEDDASVRLALSET